MEWYDEIPQPSEHIILDMLFEFLHSMEVELRAPEKEKTNTNRRMKDETDS